MQQTGRTERGGLPPSALDEWTSIAGGLAGRPLAVFLDYDGTLTPIVDRPDAAVLGEETRAVLRRDDEVGNALPERFVARPAESRGPDMVPADDAVGGVDHHDRVERGVEHRLQAGVHGSESEIHEHPILQRARERQSRRR